MASRRLFGTDGIRGRADEFFDDEFVERLGRAVVAELGGEHPSIVVLRDTRQSGERIERAFARGAAGEGAHVKLAGVLPTPAAAVLLPHYGFDAAAVISASHNPYHDNGIKFFGADGMKLADETEARIERHLELDDLPAGAPAGGTVDELLGADLDYLRALEQRFDGLDLSRWRVLLDCANGAAFQVAPEIMRRLGARVDALAVEPDGTNINVACGSTHLEGLVTRMAEGGYDIGFAFDGDADRVLAVSPAGETIDGDQLIELLARHLRERGELRGDGVAVTVMTNYGFHQAMRDAGIEVAVTPVGDRYVLEELVRRDWSLGGEQSGHIIDRGFLDTGDGIAAALLALRALTEGGRPVSESIAMRKLPQVLVNVAVRDRKAIEDAAGVWSAVDAEQSGLEGRGRVLVRPSGTEPLVRVMAEAPSHDEAQQVCDRLAGLIERELG
jgi:phosphoglucosamine mutase